MHIYTLFTGRGYALESARQLAPIDPKAFAGVSRVFFRSTLERDDARQQAERLTGWPIAEDELKELAQ